jgi:hypothetical protein
MAGEEGFGIGPTGQIWERTAWAEDWTLERKEGRSKLREFDGGFWEPKGKKGIFVISALRELGGKWRMSVNDYSLLVGGNKSEGSFA